MLTGNHDGRPADDQITELPSTFNIPAPHVIDARSFNPFVPAEKRAHPGCGLMSEAKVHDVTGLCSYADLSQPLSCTGMGDLRTMTAAKLAEVLHAIAVQCRLMNRKHAAVLASQDNSDRGHGGSVAYRPFVVTISNYGWSISCAQSAIEYFA